MRFDIAQNNLLGNAVGIVDVSGMFVIEYKHHAQRTFLIIIGSMERIFVYRNAFRPSRKINILGVQGTLLTILKDICCNCCKKQQTHLNCSGGSANAEKDMLDSCNCFYLGVDCLHCAHG